MPTVPYVTYSGAKLTPAYDPHLARERAVNIKPSSTIARGTVLGELSASPGVYAAYASTNTDGTEVAKCIAIYDIKTDSDGNVSLGTSANGAPLAGGVSGKTTPVYVSGSFKTADLTGLDATAVTDLLMRFESGDLTNGGIVRF